MEEGMGKKRECEWREMGEEMYRIFGNPPAPERVLMDWRYWSIAFYVHFVWKITWSHRFELVYLSTYDSS